MAAHRGKKFEGLNLEPVATVQTRSLRSHTVRTETSPCSGQLSTQSISEPTIEGNPGDNIEKQVKLTAEGLPENWIKEVKPQRNGLSRKNTFYVDSKTGYAFHSLEDALRYKQTGSILSCVVIPQKRSREEVLILMNSSETKCMPRQTVKTQTVMSSAQVTYQAKLGSGGLPADWIKEVKTRKKDSSRKDVFYIDPKTGYAFCSLKDALRYVETGDILSCASRPQKRSMEEIRILSSQTIKTESAASPAQPSNFIDDGISGDNVCKVVQENQLTSHGLPKRWIKELKPRKNGTKVDPIRILSSRTIKTESAASPAQPSNFIDDGISGDNVCKVVQENQLTSHGLPKSWIKELKPRKNGTKVDPFYIDPDTGYAFFSLKDALRYLATGNVLSCVMRPRKRSIEEVQALMSCSEMSSISGMKTVQRESLQLVQPNSLHRKRKRTPVKPSDLKAEEDLNIKGTDSATGTASRRVKQRIEGPLFVRASPRLLALKANIKADYDENHEENNVSCSTVPGMSNSSAPDLNRLLNSLPDPKTEEEAMAENGSSTRTPLWNGKLRRERLMPHRVSPCLATPETTDITSVENENSLISKSAHEPKPSSHLYRNRRPCSHPNLEHKEETIEGASGSSTGILLRSRKMCRERPTPLRASSPLAALKATTDGSSVEHENSMTSNALIEPSPSSLSYLNTRPTNQPDLELKEETIEVTEGSSTGTTRRRGKMYREKRTSLRASSRLAAHTDTTSVKNDNSMSNALFEPSPSLSHLKLRSTSQHDLELKEATITGANSSSTETPFRRGKMRRERGTPPLRASSHLAAQKMTNDATSVQNENSTTSNGLFGPSLSALSFLNLRPTSQPDLELKEETVEGANISSTETPLRRGKMRRERPTPLRASSHLTTLDVINNATSVENENSVTNNALFEPSPFSFSFLNVRPASLPDMELQEERIQGDNGSSAGTPLKRGEKHGVRCVPLRASSCQAALKAMADCTSEENEDNIGSNAFSVPPPSHPDLNLGSTSLGDMQFKEVITGANGNGSRTVLLTEKLHSERPANIRNSSCLSALESTMGVTADENHEENNKTSNAVSELPLSPARPDLNLGPTSQPYWEPKEETIAAVNGCAVRTASQRVEPRREMPTSVKTSPCPEALKVTTEATSSNSNEKNRMTSIALSEFSHCPDRPDLNFGPTSQLTIERQDEVSQASGSVTGTTLCRMKLHDVRPTPVNAMTEAASYYNYGNNIKISNYFCVPVESPASKIIMGSTGQPNPREVWLDTIAAAPSTAIAEVKNAPDLNMVPMSWLEPEHNLERALEDNTRPKLEQQQLACVSNIGEFHWQPPVPSEIARPKLKQQQPACVSNIGEFHWQPPVPSEIARPKLKQQQPACVSNIGEFHMQPPVPSEIPYQDPTMDALLSVQEAGPSMPHMSIDALNSPLSPFFGDFWHDPCLSYAFKTLVGGMDQQHADLGLRPENNVNWAGARNGSHIENPCVGPSDATTQTPKYMNNGMPFPK